MPPKEIHAPTYDGLDRRTNGGRRPGDFIASNWKVATIVFSIMASVFSAGIGYQSARMALADKVDKGAFDETNRRQDDAAAAVAKRVERVETLNIEQILPALKRLDSLSVVTNDRIRAIYCADKPPGCK